MTVEPCHLSNQTFSDLYLGEHVAWLTGVPSKLDPIRAPKECDDELSSLRQTCLEARGKIDKDLKEFPIRSNGVSYRASILDSLKQTVYVLRRSPEQTPELKSLGIRSNYINRLMTPKLSGLVVIAGSYNQGKTTTASSLIISRLSELGGIAVTIEDPPEMPLEGEHGEGVCFQTWGHQGSFGQACRHAARWAPTIIFLGEVRDAETATEALRASINGTLVICTTHGDNVPMAVEGLYTLASRASGSSDDVAGILSSGLTAVLHQRLDRDENGVKRLKTSFLWLDSAETGARSLIRQRKFSQLEGEVNLQLNQLMSAQKTGGE